MQGWGKTLHLCSAAQLDTPQGSISARGGFGALDSVCLPDLQFQWQLLRNSLLLVLCCFSRQVRCSNPCRENSECLRVDCAHTHIYQMLGDVPLKRERNSHESKPDSSVNVGSYLVKSG